MRKPFVLVPMIVLAFGMGCAPNFKTEKLPMPQSARRGPLGLSVKAPDDGTDTSRLKQALSEKFASAGYKPVGAGDSKAGSGRTVEIRLIKYEHTRPGSSGCVGAAAVCTNVCFIFAPCLAAPRFYEPQFELAAEVSGYNSGHRIFKKFISEKAQASANVMDAGSEAFKSTLEDLAINNFTVDVLKQMDQQ